MRCQIIRLIGALSFLAICLQAHATEAKALLWRAQKDGVRLYVYGISHFTVEPYATIPQHVKAALEESHVVITETHIGPARAPAPEELLTAGRDYAAQPYLVNAQTRARLHRLHEDGWLTKQDFASVQTNSPLTAARIIGRSILRARSSKGRDIAALHRTYGKGQDEQVLALAREAGKSLVSIEHPMTGYLYWAARCDNETDNSALLDSEIRAAFDDTEVISRLTRTPELIALGDLDALVALQHASTRAFSGTRLWIACQQTPRNHYWIGRLSTIMAEHGKTAVYFMTAGAGHLVPESENKDESLLDLLQRAGYVLTRVLPVAN